MQLALELSGKAVGARAVGGVHVPRWPHCTALAARRACERHRGEHEASRARSAALGDLGGDRSTGDLGGSIS